MRSLREPITSKRFGQVDILGSGHFRIRYFRRCVSLNISFVSITGVVSNSTAGRFSSGELIKIPCEQVVVWASR